MGFLAVKKDNSIKVGYLSCQANCIAASYAPIKASARIFSNEDFDQTKGCASLNGITAVGLTARLSKSLLLLANDVRASMQADILNVKISTIFRMRQRLNEIFRVNNGPEMITKAFIQGKLRVAGKSKPNLFMSNSISFFGDSNNEALPDMESLKSASGYQLGDLNIRGFSANLSRLLLLTAYGANISKVCKALDLESDAVRTYRADLFAHYGVTCSEGLVMAAFMEGDLTVVPCQSTLLLNKTVLSLEERLKRQFHPDYVGKKAA